MEKKRIKLYQKLKDKGLKKTYDVFLSTYFSDKTGVEKLWNNLVDNKAWGKSLSDFYKFYSCDLDWAKKTEYCKSTTTQTTQQQTPAEETFEDLIVSNYDEHTDSNGKTYYGALFEINGKKYLARLYSRGKVIVYDADTLAKIGKGKYIVGNDRISINDVTSLSPVTFQITNQTKLYKDYLSNQATYLQRQNLLKQQKEKEESEKIPKENLNSYSTAIGFNNWNDVSEVEKRVDKILDLVNNGSQSTIFYYFYKALELAPQVYPNRKDFYNTQIKRLEIVQGSKDPNENEIKSGNYKTLDLGDTGLWEKGKYFYYKKSTTTQEEQGYKLSDVNNVLELVGITGEITSRKLNETQSRSLLDLYAYYFSDEIPNRVCNIKGDLEKSLPEDLNNEQWKKIKQMLAEANNNGYFNFGRSKFCKKGAEFSDKFSIAPYVRFKKIFEYFTTEAPTNIIIRPGASSWQNQNSVITESELIKTVRKNLITEKEKKEKLLTETKVIENRLEYVLESVGLKNKNDVNRIVEGLFYEMLYLESKNYNREVLTENIQAIFDVLGSLFGGTKDSVVGTFKEKGIDFILNKLGLDKNSYMGDFLAVTFGNIDLKDIPRLFTDCEFLTKKIAESIPEAYLKNLQDEKGFDNILMDYVRNALYDVIRESDIVEKLEDRIAGIVCPITAGLTSKFEDKLTDMKSSLSQD